MSEHGGNVLETGLQLGIDPELLLDFSANINPLGLPERVRSLIVSHLDIIMQYPDVEYRHLHQALARASQCDYDQTIAGNGETELIYGLVRTLAPRRAMLLVPGFAEYRRALQQQGCEIIDYALSEQNGFQVDASLLDAVRAHRPDCLFIATPNNPTGLMPDAALLDRLASLCEAQQISLIVDEAFIDFLPQGSTLAPRLAESRYLYLLRSLTKFFAIPGLRLGYLLSGNTQTIRQLKRTREPWSVNAFSALVGQHLLLDEDYIARSHAFIARERDFLWQAMTRFSSLAVWEPQANFIFFRCLRQGFDLKAALLGHHILIRHCENYPGLDRDYYRIAVRTEAENRRFIDALTHVLQG
ncbi:threonine-phosphate decarboxylase [Lelliottia nimipressuralis]|uniref:threonine-phosphate decarboxylase CobD n=1 Tax=Lelliottia nimipressuralis TaxID=69220 RepID=UPI00106D92CE|nr:threonine-phosphate decarboxylase CobD [Lelliottia nimipressuralis]TFB23524.1 threonine-phosphate decarboxylase [Lelliottia nimipressuralis]